MTMVRRGIAGHIGEGNDAYPDVVAVLGDRTRVIVCQDGIQWVVQHRASRHDPAKMWLGHSFCRTKEALLRCSGHPDHPVLLALPDRIVERSSLAGGEKQVTDPTPEPGPVACANLERREAVRGATGAAG